MEYPIRRSPRLKTYDYSRNGYYFVTICAHEKLQYFSCIEYDAENVFKSNQLTEIGCVIEKHLLLLPKRFPNITIDKYVIMPNHIHAIIAVNLPVSKSLSEIIGSFKSLSARECIEKYQIYPIFQKSFHEHIIRNQRDYSNIWLYIDANPARWHKDCFNDKKLWHEKTEQQALYFGALE